MGKLLRVLVILFLLLSVAALVLGTKLYGQREILKGRALKLEKAIVALGTTIETEPPVKDEAVDYPAKDTSPVTDEVLDPPEYSDFWRDYASKLETGGEGVLNFESRYDEFRAYYRLDPVTGKPERDALGNRVMAGPGTLQGLLDEAIAQSGAQLDRLNATRQALRTIRTELVATIKELNENKGGYRKALKKITELEARIQPLEEKIASQAKRIDELGEEKSALEDQVADKNRLLALAAEEKNELDAKNATLKKENDEFRAILGKRQEQEPSGPSAAFTLPSGDKGSVLLVNAAWSFVVVQLSDACLKEVLGEDLTNPFQPVDLMVRRAGDQNIFVTKVKLVQVMAEQKLGLANILSDWQQLPVQEGDIVFN